MRKRPISPVHASVALLTANLLALASVSCGSARKAGFAPAAMDVSPAEAMGDMAGMDEGREPASGEARVAMVQRQEEQPMLEARLMDDARGPGQGGATGEWAAVREFPVPDYSADDLQGPRNDFRETVYWSPSVRTDASGKAQVSFYLSDAITSFRATAEGISQDGVPGRGETLITSRLPVSLAAKLPLEVSHGDIIDVPVTVENTTERWRRVQVSADFGPAFRVRDKRSEKSVAIGARKSDTVYYQLEVVGRGERSADGRIALTVESGGLSDRLERTLRVSPGGYPGERTLAGTLGQAPVEQSLTLPSTVEGSLSATLRFYPSPVATMVEGTEALIREPGGCFEQASSSNYPNVMVMRYLAENNALDGALVARTQKTMDRGYKLLTGYESKERGFEWFGGNPGHEALTAYGLMQFTEMAEVYPDLDREMVARTSAWLKSRRDGKGGYQRNSRALDTFGRASQEVTDAYITYALARTGSTDIDKELDRARTHASHNDDPYVLALSAAALLHAQDSDKDGAAALARLVARQSGDGRFSGARESITRSGGVALDIETTSLAALAMMRSPGAKSEYKGAIDKAVDWLISQRSGGRFGSTQSTILAMEALTTHSRTFGSGVPGASIVVMVNGQRAAEVALDESGDAGIELPGLERLLRTGENRIHLAARLDESGEEFSLPYDLTARYRVAAEASSPKTPVSVKSSLSRKVTRMGRSVRLSATIRNHSDAGLPMVLARLGIPGGTSYQVWQLDELRDRGVIDFYETREREVIVYFRSMAPRQVKKVNIELLASVPGTYESPESTAYLYYTDEHRHYAPPTRLRIKQPWRARAASNKAGK